MVTVPIYGWLGNHTTNKWGQSPFILHSLAGSLGGAAGLAVRGRHEAPWGRRDLVRWYALIAGHWLLCVAKRYASQSRAGYRLLIPSTR